MACRKAASLLRAGAFPTVVAPKMERELLRLGRKGRVRLVQSGFKANYLKDQILAIVATDDRRLNSEIGRLCRQRNMLVNVVDQPADCNFTVPSLFRRGALTIAISTNGASPALSKRIREELQKRYGREFGEFLRLMAKVRQEAIRRIPAHLRKSRFEKVITSNVLFLLRRGKRKKAEKRVQEILYGKGRL